MFCPLKLILLPVLLEHRRQMYIQDRLDSVTRRACQGRICAILLLQSQCAYWALPEPRTLDGGHLMQ
ncbi:JAML isoform 3 [Pan troglodytes]|uniref:JAML isoform 3 n=1 Tax=Pan troglodytes TaxID=9598 RepID=A0A2J8N2T6_PANTR|nr:JAML isoform 3 [Pan troglodytes]